MAPPSDPRGGPIFVVGAPRSGTHLLRFCISRHSRVHIGPETGFFIKVYGNRRFLPPARFPERARDLVGRLLRSGDPTMADVEPMRSQLEAAVLRGPKDYRALAEALLGGIATGAGKPRWGEKTPFHVLYVAQIRSLFPEAKVLYVARESRNVVASYLKSPLLPNDLATAVAQVSMSVRAGERAVTRGWAHRVSYEALLSDPEAVLRGVADFIGEDYEPSMLEPGMRDSSFDGGELMQREEGLGIVHDAGEADKWRGVLTPDQARWVRILVDGTGGRVPLRFRGRVLRVTGRLWLMHTKNRLGLHDLAARTGPVR